MASIALPSDSLTKHVGIKLLSEGCCIVFRNNRFCTYEACETVLQK